MIRLKVQMIGMAGNTLKTECQKASHKLREVFKKSGKDGYAFLELPDDTKRVRKIQAFTKSQKKHQWKDIVVLGIGGSALGLLAIQNALLRPFDSEPHLHAVDNIDPAYTADFFEHLDWKRTLFIVISKSGTTVEPMALYGLAKERLKKKFPKDWQRHLVFVTDPHRGLLREIAEEEGIKTFEVPEKVGGRFSVLSAVGLLPAALAGANIEGLMKGARAMRDEVKKAKGLANPALVLAAAQHWLDRKKGKTMTVMMPYSNALFRLSDWYRQLLAESLGKNHRTGPTPIQALGTTDQHSQLQLYQEGPNNKFFIFLRVLKHRANLNLGNKALPEEMEFLNDKRLSEIVDAAYLGTAASLTQNKRPNLTVELSAIRAETVGGLFMLFEIQVALLGLLYGVNAFDQPGVEASKKITQQILRGR